MELADLVIFTTQTVARMLTSDERFAVAFANAIMRNHKTGILSDEQKELLMSFTSAARKNRSGMYKDFIEKWIAEGK